MASSESGATIRDGAEKRPVAFALFFTSFTLLMPHAGIIYESFMVWIIWLNRTWNRQKGGFFLFMGRLCG
jgi:hypothetical protein